MTFRQVPSTFTATNLASPPTAVNIHRQTPSSITAIATGDLAKVRNLQKLMLRSRANALLSVWRVTEVNAGRMTAGVDGRVVLEAQDKADLAGWAQQHPRSWIPQPVRRVYIRGRPRYG
jgi:RNA-directed DNA polymerase